MKSTFLISQSRIFFTVLSVLFSGPVLADCTDRQLADALFSLDFNEKFDAASRMSEYGIKLRDIEEERGCFRVFRNLKLTVPKIDLLTHSLARLPARLKSQFCFEYFEKGDPNQYLIDEYLKTKPKGLVVLQGRFKVYPTNGYDNQSYAKALEIFNKELAGDNSIQRDMAILFDDWNFIASKPVRRFEVEFRTIQPNGQVNLYQVKIVDPENSYGNAISHFVRAFLQQEKMISDPELLKKEFSATKNFIKKAADGYGKSVSPRDKIARRWLASLRQAYQELVALENVKDLSPFDTFVALYNAKASFIASVNEMFSLSRSVQVRPDAKSFSRPAYGRNIEWEQSYWDFYMYPMFYGNPYQGGMLQRWYWLMDDVSWSARSTYDNIPYTRIEDTTGNVTAVGDDAAKLFAPSENGTIHVWDDPDSKVIWRNPDASETTLERDALDGDEARDFSDATDPTDEDGNWDDVTDDNVNDDRDSDTPSYETESNNDSDWSSSDSGSDNSSDSGWSSSE